MSLSAGDVSRLGPEAQRQIVEALGTKATRNAEDRGNKYHNIPTERVMPNGEVRTFHSAKEARRYDELMLLLKAGRIRGLKLQPQFTITEAFITPEGERVRAHRYTADFSYERYDPDAYDSVVEDYGNGQGGGYTVRGRWVSVVEDVKGGNATRTRDYRNNIKALAERGIFVREI